MGMIDQMRSTQEYSRVMSESTHVRAQIPARIQRQTMRASMEGNLSFDLF
jgi:hypothetical protein